jgi:hypothetical protein
VLLDRAASIRADSPQLMWQQVRLLVGRGLAAETDRAALRAFAEARTQGLRCLDGNPAFRARRVSMGFSAALVVLGDERRACEAWTAHAWTRWMDTLGGEAAAVDLDTLDDIMADLERHPYRFDPDLNRWTAGMLAAVRPAREGQDLALARRELRRVIESRPDDLVVHADLLLMAGREDPAWIARELAELRAREPKWPEDHQAVRRVAHLGVQP